jgi:hypothetical protein
MTAGADSSVDAERVAFNRLIWVGPLTIALAMAANTGVRLIAVAVLQPDPGFVPLIPVAPAAFTFGGALGAVVVYALVGRFSRRPIWLYERIALGALILSFIPAILIWADDAMPGTTAGGVAALLVMHIVAWAIVVGMLTRLARG